MSHPYKIGDLVSVNHQIPRRRDGRRRARRRDGEDGDPLPRLGFVTGKIDTDDLALVSIQITFLQPYASRYNGSLVTRITRARPYRGVTLVSRPEASNTGETSCLK